MQAMRLWLAGAGLIVAGLFLGATAARADVITRIENGFVVRLTSEVTASPADAWKMILTPAQWWQGQHTFSGDAANLTLDPQVGGCFCEVLPRADGVPLTQKPGGVQHMRVIYFEPPRALRLSGALGPLQSEALAATMTITVKPTDTASGNGSRILFEYVVGGFMRYKVDQIAPAVDRMLTAQLASLAEKLGPVAPPAAVAPVRSEDAQGSPTGGGETPAANPAEKPAAPLSGAENYSLPPSGEKAPKPAAKPEPAPEPSPDAKPEAKAAPQPAAKPASARQVAAARPAAAKAAGGPAAKPAPKVVATAAPKAMPAAKPTAQPSPGPLARTSAKPSAKPAAVKAPEPEAPDAESKAHRDAVAAFDATFGPAPKP